MCFLCILAIYSLLESVVKWHCCQFFPIFPSALCFWYTDRAASGLFWDRGNGIAMWHTVISALPLCLLPTVSLFFVLRIPDSSFYFSLYSSVPVVSSQIIEVYLRDFNECLSSDHSEWHDFRLQNNDLIFIFLKSSSTLNY